jgi:hypothetical protein
MSNPVFSFVKQHDQRELVEAGFWPAFKEGVVLSLDGKSDFQYHRELFVEEVIVLEGSVAIAYYHSEQNKKNTRITLDLLSPLKVGPYKIHSWESVDEPALLDVKTSALPWERERNEPEFPDLQSAQESLKFELDLIAKEQWSDLELFRRTKM